MANLNTQTFSQIVANITGAVQAAATQALAFLVGSVELSFAEAYAAVVVWLQGLIANVLALSRGSTSTGEDVDSWLADYGIVTRQAATSSTGVVTVSRFTYTASATIPAGSMFQTTDGSQSFIAIPDASNPLWDAGLSAYVIPADTQTGDITVVAETPGAASNVLANTITVISSSIPVDTVTNALAFTGGTNAESDAAVMARFRSALVALKKATYGAVSEAIIDLGLGIQFNIVANMSIDGDPQDAYFYVAIYPYSSPLQTQVYAAVDEVKALGVMFGIFPASSVAANIVTTITVAPGYTFSTVEAAIQEAITNFITAIPLGQTLFFTQLYGVIYGVPGVQVVTALTLNGGTADLVPTAQQFIAAGTISVSHT